ATLLRAEPEWCGLAAFSGAVRERAPPSLYEHPAFGPPLRQAWIYLLGQSTWGVAPPGVTAEDLAVFFDGEPERFWEARQHGGDLLIVPRDPGPLPPSAGLPLGTRLASLGASSPHAVLRVADQDTIFMMSATEPVRAPMPNGLFSSSPTLPSSRSVV